MWRPVCFTLAFTGALAAAVFWFPVSVLHSMVLHLCHSAYHRRHAFLFSSLSAFICIAGHCLGRGSWKWAKVNLENLIQESSEWMCLGKASGWAWWACALRPRGKQTRSRWKAAVCFLKWYLEFFFIKNTTILGFPAMSIHLSYLWGANHCSVYVQLIPVWILVLNMLKNLGRIMITCGNAAWKFRYR